MSPYRLFNLTFSPLEFLFCSSFDSSTRSDFPEVLLNFSKQIALGIQYLSSKSFVHRDLAARNVLVTKDCICKVRFQKLFLKAVIYIHYKYRLLTLVCHVTWLKDNIICPMEAWSLSSGLHPKQSAL